jgi:hypothetical protein
MPVAPCTAGGFFVERSKVLTFRCLKIEVLACISHQLSAAAVNLQQSAAFAPIGVLDVPQVRAPRLRGSARAPRVVRCVRHGSGFEAPRRRRCPTIAEERQRRRRGHAAATLRADGGRGRSLRCSSLTMLGHRLPPRALISTHETHRRTALGTRAEPLGRKLRISLQLPGLATKAGEICRQGAMG